MKPFIAFTALSAVALSSCLGGDADPAAVETSAPTPVVSSADVTALKDALASKVVSADWDATMFADCVVDALVASGVDLSAHLTAVSSEDSSSESDSSVATARQPAEMALAVAPCQAGQEAAAARVMLDADIAELASLVSVPADYSACVVDSDPQYAFTESYTTKVFQAIVDAPVSADSMDLQEYLASVEDGQGSILDTGMDAMWGAASATSYDADCGGFATDLRKQVLYGVEVVDRDTLKLFFVDGFARAGASIRATSGTINLGSSTSFAAGDLSGEFSFPGHGLRGGTVANVAFGSNGMFVAPVAVSGVESFPVDIPADVCSTNFYVSQSVLIADGAPTAELLERSDFSLVDCSGGAPTVVYTSPVLADLYKVYKSLPLDPGSVGLRVVFEDVFGMVEVVEFMDPADVSVVDMVNSSASTDIPVLESASLTLYAADTVLGLEYSLAEAASFTSFTEEVLAEDSKVRFNTLIVTDAGDYKGGSLSYSGDEARISFESFGDSDVATVDLSAVDFLILRFEVVDYSVPFESVLLDTFTVKASVR